jgi:ABC-type transport system involved in multi-copper enzyme maturation permease subunit
LAFWATLISFAMISGLATGQGLYWAFTHPTSPFVLPDVWTQALQNPLPGIFGAVALVLLITAEFSWKTARQNVIDGLSKEEFFVAKLILWPVVIVLFVSVLIGITGILGAVGTIHAGTHGPFIRRTDVALMGGTVLGALGYSSIAYFSAFVARSSGAAMGLFFLYIAFVEELIGGLLGRIGDTGQALARYLPRGVFDQLMRSVQYDVSRQQEMIARAVKAGRDVPQLMDTQLLIAVAALWIGVFIGASFWIYRRRDL